MSKHLRVLIVEDSPDDAALCLRELRRGDFATDHLVVDSTSGFCQALQERRWDVILCDYTMPGFGGTEAFAIVQAKEMDTPFLYVSGTIGEEAAVEAIRQGADDYVLKGNLRRLAPAVERALASAAARRERDEAIRDARAIEGRLGRVLEIAPDAILAVDQRKRIVMFNRAAELMFGVSAVSVGDQPVDSMVPGLFAGGLIPGKRGGEHGASALAPQPAAAPALGTELVGRRRDGAAFPVEVSVTRYLDGADGMDLAIIRDITARKAIEEQLRHSQKMEVIGQLTGGIAHDFNNLLTVIMGNLELLLEEANIGPYTRELATSAYEGSRRGAELVGNMMAFCRRQALRPGLVDLNDLILRIAEFLRRTLGEQIHISTALSSDVWPIYVDRDQMASAITNLSINSRDAMPEGGRLTISTANRASGSFATGNEGDLTAGDYVELTVADTGTGMAPDVLERAFEPFFTTKVEGEGTGLGLSTVFGFVRQSGGDIQIRSEPGQETSVTLYLPRAADVVEAKETGRPASREAAKTVSFRAHILVVDDNRAVLKIAARALEHLGYKVTQASSGEDALQALETDSTIDLLFTDVVMPGMFGSELARQVNARFPDMKVLFTSGNASATDGSIKDIPYLGEMLTKPWLATDLEEAVDRVIRSRRPPGQSRG